MRDALSAPFKNLLVKAPVTIEQYTAAPGPCKVASAVPFRGHRLTRETVSMVAPSYWSQTLRSAYWGRLSVGDLVALGTRWSLVGPLREPGRNLDGQPDNDLFSLVCCPVAIVRVFKFWLTGARDFRRHTTALAKGQSGQTVAVRDFERRDQYD